jgi:hypothetical protein
MVTATTTATITSSNTTLPVAQPTAGTPPNEVQTATATKTSTTTQASPIDPTTLPLIQAKDFSYLGAFVVPGGFSGQAVTTYRNPKTSELTLFYRGHDQSSDTVGEMSIPKTLGLSQDFQKLPRSQTIQPWTKVTEGKLDGLNETGIGNAAGNGSFIYGLLADGEKLTIAASTIYSNTPQTASLATSSTSLSAIGDFNGFFALTGKVKIQRAMGGSMAWIPAEWQKTLGGKAIVGNAPTSIISNNSFGPAITVFDPDTLGTSNEGETLVFYPQANPMCGTVDCERTLNPVYTWSSGFTGRAFPRGSRSILAVGIHPTGEIWYGGPISPTGTAAFCNDGGWGQKASGHESRVFAYDANDLLAVKKGLKQTWQVMPYAHWRLPEVERSSCWTLTAATFDNESGLLFVVIREDRFLSVGSRVEVYKIKGM